jgi:hypothetical protein
MYCYANCGNTARDAVVGGTISVIGGGKFANGAQTGAFRDLFNEGTHDAQKPFESLNDLNPGNISSFSQRNVGCTVETQTSINEETLSVSSSLFCWSGCFSLI